MVRATNLPPRVTGFIAFLRGCGTRGAHSRILGKGPKTVSSFLAALDFCSFEGASLEMETEELNPSTSHPELQPAYRVHRSPVFIQLDLRVKEKAQWGGSCGVAPDARCALYFSKAVFPGSEIVCLPWNRNSGSHTLPP